MRTFLTVLFWTIALALGAATAAANFRYGWLVGHGEERWVYALGGTFLDVGKTFLPVAMGTFLAGPLTAGTFFQRLAGWTVWGLAVAWSVTCAMGLYSISRDANAGDALGRQAQYKQLTADQTRKQGELKTLQGVRLVEVIDGEIAAMKRDRLWTRTRECADATATESRDFCAKIDKLTAERATVRPSADVRADVERLQAELRGIETKLAGIDMTEIMKKADPATEALAKTLNWSPDDVKNRLAVLIAILFECGGLLPWIITGSHGAPRRKEKDLAADPSEAPRKTAKTKPEAPAVEAPAEPTEAPTPIELPEVDSLVASWAKGALVRRKGSYVPAAELYEQFSQWCRLHNHDTPKQTAFGKMMTDLGFERRKQAGQQRYVDLAMIPKVREFTVVEGGAAAGAV